MWCLLCGPSVLHIVAGHTWLANAYRLIRPEQAEREVNGRADANWRALETAVFLGEPMEK